MGRSFIYYLIAVVLISTADFKQVHAMRIEWLQSLMAQSGPEQRVKTGVVFYDYLAHLDPDYALHYVRLGNGYAMLNDQRQAQRCYRKARALDPAVFIPTGLKMWSTPR